MFLNSFIGRIVLKNTKVLWHHELKFIVTSESFIKSMFDLYRVLAQARNLVSQKYFPWQKLRIVAPAAALQVAAAIVWPVFSNLSQHARQYQQGIHFICKLETANGRTTHWFQVKLANFDKWVDPYMFGLVYLFYVKVLVKVEYWMRRTFTFSSNLCWICVSVMGIR